MVATTLQVAAAPGAWADALTTAIGGIDVRIPLLVNIGVWPDLAGLIERCEAFALAGSSGDSLILSILIPDQDGPPLQGILAAAGAWAFTRHAALAWAARGMRLNMIGLGTGPPAPPDPIARGRSAAAVQAAPATIDDVVRTVHAMAGWPSMTGQFIRLGAL